MGKQDLKQWTKCEEDFYSVCVCEPDGFWKNI